MGSSHEQHLSKELMHLAKAVYVPAELKDLKSTSKLKDKQAPTVAGQASTLVFCLLRTLRKHCRLHVIHMLAGTGIDLSSACEEKLFPCTGHYFPSLPKCRDLRR